MQRWNQRFAQLSKDEPFFNTVSDGDLNKIKQMVENEGANVNAMNSANCTVMMLAGNIGRVDIMEYLFSKGAKVETASSYNDLSITRPIGSGHIDVVEFYIKHGVDLNATGHFYQSALHAAADSSSDSKTKIIILELLKKHDGIKNIDMVDHDGNTPLMSSILHRRMDSFTWLLDNGADPTIKNKKSEDAFELLKSRNRQEMFAIFWNKLKTLSNDSSNSQALIYRELLDKIRSVTITAETIKQLPNMNEEKIVYFNKHKEELSSLTQKGVSLSELAAADFSVLKNVIDNLYCLDNILKVVTLKQILSLDHTPPELPKDFKLDLPLPGFDSGTGGGGTPEEFLIETSHRHIKVTYQHDSHYEVSWTRLEKDTDYYDKLACEQKKQERYLYRWVTLDVNDAKPSPVIQRNNPQSIRLVSTFKFNFGNKSILPSSSSDDDFSDYDENDFNQSKELEVDDKIRRVIYSPDTKQFIYEKYDKEFPIEKFLKEHLWGLYEAPYYHEQCTNETLAARSYSYEKLRAITGMTETKLSILTTSTTDVVQLVELMPIEELMLINDERLHFLVKNFDKYVKPALKFVDFREIVGFNDIPKLTDNLSPKSQRKVGMFDQQTIIPDTQPNNITQQTLKKI